MIATIDRKTCIGCFLCCGMAEGVFEIEGKKARQAGDKARPRADADLTDKRNQKEAKEAEEACPVDAIKIFD